MSTDPVSVTVDGEVATVTIDRPERRNALDSAAASAVRAAIEQASSARAIILTGSGKAFCAGGDLEELERWTELPTDDISSTLYEGFQGMIRAIRSSDAVVIAAINGAAVGAGLDLALACDIRVAAAGAKLGEVWVGLGVIPGTGGAWLAQSLAGPTKAAELLLTGEIITAEEAHAAGLVNEVVAADDLLSCARRWTDRILKHPRGGVIANKRAMVLATEAALEAALDHARKVQPERFTSEEFKAQLKARGRR